MAVSMSWDTLAAIDSALPFDTSSKPIEIISSTLKQTASLIQSDGIRGTRSRYGDRVKQGQKSVAGDLVLNPTPIELDTLLPYILGANESTDVFAVADTLPSFYVMLDRVQKLHTYAGLVVARAVFDFTANQLVRLTLSLVGTTETEANAGGFPSLTIDTGEAYVMHQGVLSLHSSNREFNSARLTIDNAPLVLYRNNQEASAITPGDRVVTLDVELPYDSSNYDIYTSQEAGTWASGSLTLTNGNQSLLFSMNSLRSEPGTPDIQARGQELVMPLSFRAYMTGSTREIQITNDSTT